MFRHQFSSHTPRLPFMQMAGRKVTGGGGGGRTQSKLCPRSLVSRWRNRLGRFFFCLPSVLCQNSAVCRRTRRGELSPFVVCFLCSSSTEEWRVRRCRLLEVQCKGCFCSRVQMGSVWFQQGLFQCLLGLRGGYGRSWTGLGMTGRNGHGDVENIILLVKKNPKKQADGGPA